MIWLPLALAGALVLWGAERLWGAGGAGVALGVWITVVALWLER